MPIDRDLIDRMAGAMCEELGLDPDEYIFGKPEQTMTQSELADYVPPWSGVSVYHGPRWKAYRPQAEMELAMARARRRVEQEDRND